MDRTRWVVAFTGLALLAVASTIYATSLGAGLIADSKYYLEAAQGLLHGQGYTVPTPLGGAEPLTNWPPLFSASLAGLGLLGLDLHAGARWLNAVLLGGTVVLGMLAIRHVTRGSFVAAVFGGFLLATSLDLLSVFSQAGSEPLFLFFGLLGLILVAAHIESPTPRRLLGASAAIALAFLSRYPGVVLVVAGAIGILLFDPRTWRHRGRDAGILAGLSALPMIVWMGRNWLSARQPMGSFRVLEVHPLTPAQLRLGLDTVWGWISPGQGLGRGPASIVAHVVGLRWIALVTVVAGSAVAARRWRRWRAGKKGTEPLLAPPLLRLLVTFTLLYLGFMVVSISFFDATIPLDQRLLSPVFPAAVILAVGAGSRLVEAFRGSAVARGVIGFGCLILGAVYADAAVHWVRQAHAKGLGYADKGWQRSDVLREVRALPAGVLIYTNGDDAVVLVTDRLALELPRKIRLNTGQPNPSYEAELAAMEDHLRAGAVLVYLRRVTWRTALYGSEAELKERLNLRVRSAAADGSIYDVAP
jgi:hypothetical protein